MRRSLSLLLIRQFFVVLFYAIGFTAIMVLESLLAIIRGVWVQSDHIAKTWMEHVHIFRVDSVLNSPIYWVVRFTSILLMVFCMMLISRILFLWIFGS